ncbi:hypothetical protein BDC45DRAFT_506734 [Circinella umbellata]|nr:hypothetical protein BDC45DRAFT_506734 [Circinella umbellata]
MSMDKKFFCFVYLSPIFFFFLVVARPQSKTAFNRTSLEKGIMYFHLLLCLTGFFLVGR